MGLATSKSRILESEERIDLQMVLVASKSLYYKVKKKKNATWKSRDPIYDLEIVRANNQEGQGFHPNSFKFSIFFFSKNS